MSKDSKARRERKTAQGSARMKRQPQEPQARRREEIWGPTFYVVPNPFEQLNVDQQRLAVQEIAENSEKEYQEALSDLRGILRCHHPLLVLSLMSYYNLSVTVDKITGVTKLESDLDILPSDIEILQELYLQIKVNDLFPEQFSLDVLQKIHSHAKKLNRAYPFRQIDSGNVDLLVNRPGREVDNIGGKAVQGVGPCPLVAPPMPIRLGEEEKKQ